jgi:hypothetical protein
MYAGMDHMRQFDKSIFINDVIKTNSLANF